MSTVNGFQVGSETLKYNYESLDNYNTPNFSSSSSTTYAVGDYVTYNGKLYKCTTATTGGTWVSGSWALAVLSDDVSDLTRKLNEISTETWVSLDTSFASGYIYTNVNIGTTVDINRISNTQLASAIIPCLQGDKFVLTGTGGNGSRVWAFCDTEYHLLSKSTNDLTVTDLELTASEDGYIIVNAYIEPGYSLKMSELVVAIQKSYTDILDNFAQSVGEVAEIGGNWSSDLIPDHGQIAEWINKISLFETGAITTNVEVGDVVDITRIASDAFDSAIAPCKVGDVFKLTGTGGYSSRLWAFCDSDYKLISKSAADITVENLVIVAPANGYLICTMGKANKALYAGFYASISAFNPTLAELYNLWDSLVSDYPNYITKTDLGLDQSGEYHLYKYSFVPESISVEGADIFSLPDMPKILLGSGTHGNGEDAGDKPEMVVGVYYFFKNICDNWYGNDAFSYLRHHVCIEVIPVQNPWGYVNKSRRNSRQVDINSNFPFGWTQGTQGSNTYGGTAPFSEAESVIIKNFIENNTDALFYLDLHTTGGIQTQQHMIYYSMAPNENLIVPANDTVIYLSDKWNHENIANLDTSILHGFIHSGGKIGRGEIYRWVNSTVGIPACVMEAFPNFENSGLSNNSELVMRMCQEELATFIIKCIRYFKFNYLSNQR